MTPQARLDRGSNPRGDASAKFSQLGTALAKGALPSSIAIISAGVAHLKPADSLPEKFRKLLVSDAEMWTPTKEMRVSRLIGELATIEGTLTTKPMESPWAWLRATQLTPIDFTSIVSHCRGVVEAIVDLEVRSHELRNQFGVPVPIWACLEKTDTNSGGFDVV